MIDDDLRRLIREELTTFFAEHPDLLRPREPDRPRNTDRSRLLTQQEAAESLGGLSRVTVYRLVKDGHLEQVKIGSRSFIRWSSVEKLIALGGATGRCRPEPSELAPGQQRAASRKRST